MLVWVNRKKARREIKTIWEAYFRKGMNAKESIKSTAVFAENMVELTFTLGISDPRPPCDWPDDKLKRK